MQELKMIEQELAAPAATRLRDGQAVTIRRLAERDTGALAAFGQSLPPHDWQYLPEDLQNPDIIRRLVNAHAAANWRQIVAESEQGAIVGYGSVRLLPGWSNHVADIRLLVAAPWRRVGLGSAMAPGIFAAARDLGVSKVIVEMIAEQTDAQAIFARLGFHVEGRLVGHARDRNNAKHDLLIMAFHF
jgi:RimJ/RimL family protein N-acetyltransferase